jgi:hypothetical protein
MVRPLSLQLAILGAAMLLLVSCGGGSSSLPSSGNLSGPNPFLPLCDPGTQVQLANPTAAQTGVPANVGQIIIVANGSANTLHDTYGQWNLTVTDNFGNAFIGGSLNLVPLPNGPHPYPSDFYYASSISSLPSARTLNVTLTTQNKNCTGNPLGSFST